MARWYSHGATLGFVEEGAATGDKEGAQLVARCGTGYGGVEAGELHMCIGLRQTDIDGAILKFWQAA